MAPPDPLRSAAGARRRAVVAPPTIDYAVEAYSLRKVYRTRNGKQAAVDGLDLRVPLGGIHGFLGPNGSGKTTTIRMLLGLIAADYGHIRIFDHEVPLAINQIIDRVGAIVEQPKFFPSFSGQHNLQLLARAIGAPRRRVDAVLHEVGLAGRGSDKFRSYSLGMKQRLAIAATLLKDPDLLIFDEPTNGLDPAGIHEIRTMMLNLARRGKTVLVSSHILSEVQLHRAAHPTHSRRHWCPARVCGRLVRTDGHPGCLAVGPTHNPVDPEGNLAAILEDGYSYSAPVEKVMPDGMNVDFVQHTVSLTHGVVYSLTLVPLAVVGSFLIFRRRDVI